MPKIRRALLSVSDKTGILDLAAALHRHGVEILSTGGTAQVLDQAGIPVVPIERFTGQPEILDGQVKTLTPRIHGGLLGRRASARHRREMTAHGIKPIDLVAVNLHPFESVAFGSGSSFKDVVENIDIEGPAMVRCAAKNFRDVTVVVEPADYPMIIEHLSKHRGTVTAAVNYALARKAFIHTAYYDSVIAGWLPAAGPERPASCTTPEPLVFPPMIVQPLLKVQDLRYGENPHQRAALYREPGPAAGVAGAEQLGGKELSFNNLLDLEAAWTMARDFAGRSFVVIVKHNNPCGAGGARDVTRAFDLALAGDPVSAFGGVIGASKPLTVPLARKITETFFEAVIAPGYAPRALEILRAKKGLRILQAQSPARTSGDLRRIEGGYLLQDPDTAQIRDVRRLPVVTRRPPTAAEYRALEFAWRMVRHVKSNAIIFTNEEQLLGVGAGQMSRVDSCSIAAMKAVLPLQGSVVASDAFFPFRDGLDRIAGAGATAVIQPGGSLRDKDAIEAADEHGMAMVFTGVRHFKH